MYTHDCAVTATRKPSGPHGRFGVLTAAFLSLSALGLPVSVRAEPVGGVVTAGQVTVTYQGANTNINQSTPSASINWDSFSVGPGEHTAFTVPDAASVTLNKVVGNNPSEILGRLSSNGQLYLMNPSGIFFRPGSQVDVAALVADTQGYGAIMHEGVINASGDVIFRAPSITVSGNINAGGKVGMYADVFGNGTLFVPVASSVGVINMSGVVSARNVEVHGDIVRIGGTIDVSGHGIQDGGRAIILSEIETRVNGIILATAGLLGGNGGFVETSSHGVLDIAGATVDASATYGTAGTWLLDPPDYALDAAAATAITAALVGTNVTVETEVIGPGTGNINISASLTIPTARVLTLNAFNNIVFGAGTQFTVSSGGTLNLRADSTGTTQDTGGQGTIIGTSGTHINGAGTVNMYYRPYASNGAGALSYALGSGFFSSFVSGPTVTRWEILASTADGTQFMTDSNAGNVNHNIFLARNITAWATPINSFTGQFDGNFKTIGDRAYSNAGVYSFGMFKVMSNVTVKNLTLNNISVNVTAGSPELIGLLAGYIDGSSVNIDNLIITNGSITSLGVSSGYGISQGLVAGELRATSGVIKNLNIQGLSSTAAHGVGGLFGNIGNNTPINFVNLVISDSVVNVEVRGNTSVGGVAGTINNTGPVGAVLLEHVDNLGHIYGVGYTGGLYGNTRNYKIVSSRNFGTIHIAGAAGQFGGLVGLSGNTGAFGANLGTAGIIEYSSNYGQIVNDILGNTVSVVGGLVGGMNNGTIIAYSSNYGDLNLTFSGSGSVNIGGIVGDVSSHSILSSISNVSNSGNITINYSGSGYVGNVGGIAGHIASGPTLSNAVNSGNVSAPKAYAVGGLVGAMIGSEITGVPNNNILSNGVNYGNITGTDLLGGIVGQTFGYRGTATLSKVVNFGDVILSPGTFNSLYAGFLVGGIAGVFGEGGNGINADAAVDFGSYGNIILSGTANSPVWMGGVMGAATSNIGGATYGVVALQFSKTTGSTAPGFNVGIVRGSGSGTNTSVAYDSVKVASGNVSVTSTTGATGYASGLDNLTTLGLTGRPFTSFTNNSSSVYVVPNFMTFNTISVVDLTGAADTSLDTQALNSSVAGFTTNNANFSRIMYSGTTAQAFRVDGSAGKILSFNFTLPKGIQASGGAQNYGLYNAPTTLYANTTSFEISNLSTPLSFRLSDFYGNTFGSLVNSAFNATLTSAATNVRFYNSGTTKPIVLPTLTLTGTGKLMIDDTASSNVWKVNTVTAAGMDFVFNQNNSAVEIQPSGTFQVKSIALGATNTINLAFPTVFNTALSSAQHTITAVGGITGPVSPITTTGFSTLRYVNGTGTAASALSQLTLDIRNSNLAANTVLNLPRLNMTFNGDWNVGTVINAIEAHITAEGGSFLVANLANATLNIKGILELIGSTVAAPAPVVATTTTVSTTPSISVLVNQLIQLLLSPAQSSGGSTVDLIAQISAPPPVVAPVSYTPVTTSVLPVLSPVVSTTVVAPTTTTSSTTTTTAPDTSTSSSSGGTTSTSDTISIGGTSTETGTSSGSATVSSVLGETSTSTSSTPLTTEEKAALQGAIQDITAQSAAAFTVTASVGASNIPVVNAISDVVNAPVNQEVAILKTAAQNGLSSAIETLTAAGTEASLKKAAILQGVMENINNVSAETIVLSQATMSAIAAVLPAGNTAVASATVVAPAITVPDVNASALPVNVTLNTAITAVNNGAGFVVVQKDPIQVELNAAIVALNAKDTVEARQTAVRLTEIVQDIQKVNNANAMISKDVMKEIQDALLQSQ